MVGEVGLEVGAEAALEALRRVAALYDKGAAAY